MHIKRSPVLPFYHALTGKNIAQLCICVIPVFVKAQVKALYTAHLPVELTANIREFAKCTTFSKFLVKRIEQVPVVVFPLDTGIFQLFLILFAVNAAGTARTAYHLAPRRRKEKFALFEAAVHKVSRVLSYRFTVSLICGEQRRMHKAVSYKFITHNSNIIGNFYADLVKLVDKSVCHIVVGADYRLRKGKLSAVIALSKLFTRIHPEVSKVHALFIILDAVLF